MLPRSLSPLPPPRRVPACTAAERIKICVSNIFYLHLEKHVCSQTGFIHFSHTAAPPPPPPRRRIYSPHHQNPSRTAPGQIPRYSLDVCFYCGVEYQNWKLTGPEASGLKVFTLQPPPLPQRLMKREGLLFRLPPRAAQRAIRTAAFSSLPPFRSSAKPSLSL